MQKNITISSFWRNEKQLKFSFILRTTTWVLSDKCHKCAESQLPCDAKLNKSAVQYSYPGVWALGITWASSTWECRKNSSKMIFKQTESHKWWKNDGNQEHIDRICTSNHSLQQVGHYCIPLPYEDQKPVEDRPSGNSYFTTYTHIIHCT